MEFIESCLNAGDNIMLTINIMLIVSNNFWGSVKPWYVIDIYICKNMVHFNTRIKQSHYTSCPDIFIPLRTPLV